MSIKWVEIATLLIICQSVMAVAATAEASPFPFGQITL
jgi:hypothetical protein